MEDWYKPLDPRQFYYATYNIARANMNQAVERNFAFIEERGLIEKLSAEAKAQIERGLLPLRHLHWGSNMNMTEITQRGYGTAVTAPCIFSAGDHLGMAQIISRIGLELDGQTGASLDKAKETWLGDAAWQGARRLIEDTFVERDFFQLYVAQTLAVNGVLFDMVYKHADAAWREGALPVAMLTEFMSDWRAEEGRWSDHVVKTVAAESEANKTLVSEWASHWIDRAIEAAKPLSDALLNDGGKAASRGGRRGQDARAFARPVDLTGGTNIMMQVASLTLLHNDDARPIIEAIMADNPGVRVLDMPGCVKLDRDMELVVNRASVEERIGRAWDPQEIHLVLVSMAGNLDEDDDRFLVGWKH